MRDEPPKPPGEGKSAELINALEAALLEARQRVEEAIAGLRAVIRRRQGGKLADDTGRYVRSAKAPARPAERRRPRQK